MGMPLDATRNAGRAHGDSEGFFGDCQNPATHDTAE